MILAGDIGGTKTNLARFEMRSGRLEKLGGRQFASQAFSGLESMLDTFLAEFPGPVDAACFGIAGPVADGRCETTNLAWNVDASRLQPRLKTRVWLLNDLEATGYGIPALSETEMLTLQVGQEGPGNAVLIAAGTGLGECFLFRSGRELIPSASEGGHTDFAPRNAFEWGLLERLIARLGHVSYERILSGAGFVELFDYLVAVGGVPSVAVAMARAEDADPAPAISQAGLDGSCPVCHEVIEYFLEIYGAEAGNLALKGLSTAGVFVGGGIAPRLLSRLKGSRFLDAFLDKGRFRGMLEKMPVKVILNPETALLGAARFAWLHQEK
jgi:glucokinase